MLDDLAIELHATAIQKGFWLHQELHIGNGPPLDNPSIAAEKIALMHSELSEALEGLRDDDMEQVEEELADCIIRILDFAAAYNLSMDTAINKKAAFNKTRPFMHGRKL